MGDTVFSRYLNGELARLHFYYLPQGIDEVRKIIGFHLEDRTPLNVWHYTGVSVAYFRAENPRSHPIYIYY